MRFTFPQPLLPLLLLAVLLLSAGSPLFAQAPAWQDATSPGAGRGTRIAVDAAGNTYVTGSFSGTATFGAITLTSAGGDDIFGAKRTPAGAWQWATGAGGSDDDYGLGVAVDGSGSVVVTGYFTSPTITFGATTLTNATRYYRDIYVAKLTSVGTWQWATGAGGINFDFSNGVALDGSGNVVVAGVFESPTITFGATTLTSAGPGDLFVAKLTSAGVWLWAARAGGTNNDMGYSIAVDGSGSVVVMGIFYSRTITFDAITVTSTGVGDTFVAKLTPAGAWQWATSAGGSGVAFGRSMAVDGSGNVVVTGVFVTPTITFGATTLTNAGYGDLFVAKLTPAGAWQWATGAGSSDDDAGLSVAVDGSGSVVVTGYFTSPTITFGATTLANPTPGAQAIFLARLSGTTGLPEAPDQPALTLTPNPARTTVQLTGAAGPTATLLDGLGRMVGSAPVTPAGTATLDVRALPAGLYLVRAGGAARRLVVE